MRRKKSIIIGWNIWMFCLELNWFFYDQSRILQLSEFLWTLPSFVWVVFNNLLLIDATDRSKISSNHHQILYPLSFFVNTPFHAKLIVGGKMCFRHELGISNNNNICLRWRGRTEYLDQPFIELGRTKPDIKTW